MKRLSECEKGYRRWISPTNKPKLMNEEHTGCMTIGPHPRRTPQDVLDYWKEKITKERDSQASCLRHGMPDQSKWHEGIADAGEQFVGELEYLIMPLLKQP